MRSTHSRRTTATGALIAAAALLAVGVQTGAASAAPDSGTARTATASKANPGALAKQLSPRSGPS